MKAAEIEILLFLLADLIIIIVAARALGALARRVGQPAVVGEVVAGMLLGPTVLGRIAPSVPAWLFPREVPLKEIADLGLVFFMFLVGLELDTGLMKKEGRRALLISLSGIAAPFFLGMLLGWPLSTVNALGVFQEGTSHPPAVLTFSLFLGSAMCITAFPILARIMVETGLYKAPVGISALCAAAVDDAIAWILLAAVIGLTKNGSAAKAAPALMLTIVFVIVMFTLVRRLLMILERRYLELGRLSVDHVAIALVGVLLSALATEKIGIHAIFGAFVFGAVMPKGSGMARELTEKIEDFTVVVLLPVFFAVTGLRTNLFALNNVSLLGWLLLILLTATVGKFVGTGLAAKLTGSSSKDAVIIGALMNTRGLTELVILSIGLSLGVLSDRTFAMMVIMALATTVMAAPIVNRLVSRDELVADLIGSGGEESRPAARVLVAIGNPLNAPHLVDAALRMTGGRRPAELLLVRLIPTPRAPEFHTGLLEVESQVAAAVESMRPLVEQAGASDVLARPISFLSDAVGPDLARIAADQHCDAILLGWHRASLARHVVQALVLKTFELAPCDVAVLVDREGRGVPTASEKPVAVVLTDPKAGEATIQLGVDLAQSLSAPIRLVSTGGAARNGVSGTAASEALANRADELRRETGLWVVPVFADGDGRELASRELDDASAAVIAVGADWATTRDFGRPTEALADAAGCPVLVVRTAPRPQSQSVAAPHGGRPATV